MKVRPSDLLIFLFLLSSCDRGCGRRWFDERAPSAPASASPLVPAVDCPDGLARCEAGEVLVSRLAAIPQPCKGTPKDCTCPWDRIGTCPGVSEGAGGCVAEGAEVVVERSRAVAQLCVPSRDAGPLSAAPAPGALPTTSCDEGDLYKCAGGAVVACSGNALVAQCVRGCAAEGAGVDDD